MSRRAEEREFTVLALAVAACAMLWACTDLDVESTAGAPDAAIVLAETGGSPGVGPIEHSRQQAIEVNIEPNGLEPSWTCAHGTNIEELSPICDDDDVFADEHFSHGIAELAPGEHPELAVCPNSRDTYEVAIGASDSLRLTLQPAPGSAPLSAMLRGPLTADGSYVIHPGMPTADGEIVFDLDAVPEHLLHPAGHVMLKVWSRGDSTRASYDLSLEVN